MRLRLLKTVLWFLSGAGLTVIIMRIIHGPGSVVALTDILPWGLWKGGGVVALVPIGGAGFTLAAFVYVLRWERYKPLARGAVLLGLMCYSSVAVGLTFDIGIWWRIVYPVVFWQFHSTLFEIAWCIMLYLGVLVAEFSHAVLEKLNFPRLLKFVEKFSIVFVIAGISLSTLHQSSLGTLFLATPYRLHPLWHTDLLPLLFFITSVGLGCLTITWVTLVVHHLYGAAQPMHALEGLGRIAAWVLGAYLVVKFAEILAAGEAALLVAPGWNTANFWCEVLLAAVLPVALLAVPRLRRSPAALFWISTSAVVGMSLNRVNVAGLATLSATGATYFPIWPEWAVTIGILSFAALVYLFCLERFDVFEAIDRQAVERAYQNGRVDPADWKTIFFHNPLSEVRVYSFAFVLAAGLVFGSLPDDAVFGVRPASTPVSSPPVVEIAKAPRPDGPGTRFMLAPDAPAPPNATRADVLLIDGNRDDDFVLFDHRRHVELAGSEGRGCTWCHHMNPPLAKATGCSRCHADMYLARDIFDHDLHQQALGGNQGCHQCHRDPARPKTRADTPACATCHPDLRPAGTLVEVSGGKHPDAAPGYMDAMHGLCVSCHQQRQDQLAVPWEGFSRCAACHRDTPAPAGPARIANQ